MRRSRPSPAWRRIPPDSVVLADFRGGERLCVIAARYGVSRSAVSTTWKRLGLERKRGGPRVIPADDILVNDFDSGEKQIVLATHYGVSVQAVSQAWRRLGLSRKGGVSRVHRSPHPWGDEHAL